MPATGIDYVYIETHDWAMTAKWWQELGFMLDFDLGDAGLLIPPDGGPGVFVEQVPEGKPLAFQVYLKVPDTEWEPGDPVEVVGEFTPSHWDTHLLPIRDPDGRTYVLQAPGSGEGAEAGHHPGPASSG